MDSLDTSKSPELSPRAQRTQCPAQDPLSKHLSPRCSNLSRQSLLPSSCLSRKPQATAVSLCVLTCSSLCRETSTVRKDGLKEEQRSPLPLNDSRTLGVAGSWSWMGVAGQALVSREAQRMKAVTSIVGGAWGPGSRLQFCGHLGREQSWTV